MSSEGKRTNHCLQSDNLGRHPWKAHRCVVEPYEPGPTGVAMADKIVAEKGATISQVLPAVFRDGEACSFSTWVKSTDDFALCFKDEEVGTRHCLTFFTWRDGILDVKNCRVGAALAAPPLPWTKPSDVDWDWYQAVVACGLGPVIGSHYHRVLLRFDDGGVFCVFGAQVEVGPFPSSYIRTTSKPVTREADIWQTPNAGIGRMT